MNKLHGWLWPRWKRHADRRARRRSPRYCELADFYALHERADGSITLNPPGGSVEMWFEMVEISSSITPYPWWLRAAAHAPWWPAQKLYRDARAFIQRGRRGYADRDVYSLHHHLSRVISGSVRRFAELTYSYPGDLTEGHWDEILGEIAATFEASLDDNAEEIDMSLFEKWYFGLWS